MRRILMTLTMIFALVGVTACGEPSPKVGDPPETSSSAPAEPETPADTTPPVEEPDVQEAAAENPEPEDDFDYGDTMVSLNEAYQMTAIGEWSIARVEPTYQGYPEGVALDPLEQWLITHPDVDMQGELVLGADLGQTAPRPVFVLDSMTEEELPHLSSHYGNAYLIEGVIEVGGVTMYQVRIVTDHRSDKQISEADQYYGDRTPPPVFFFFIHTTDTPEFEEYRHSQARQDLLQMFRTLHIEDPPYFEEGVDLENPPWEEDNVPTF